MIMRITLFLFTLLFLNSFRVQAQQISVDPSMETYQMALDFYNTASYASAYKTFSQLDEMIEDKNCLLAIQTDYYKALSAMYLYTNDAEFLLKKFLDDYPNSSLYYNICLNLADFYFSKRAYNESLVYYELIDKFELQPKEVSHYTFNYAYCLFSLGDLNQSSILFKELIINDNPFQDDAKYYYAYIAYANGNYATSKKFFQDLLDRHLYSKQIPLYISQIYHKQLEYQKLLDFSLAHVDSISTSSSELYKLIAEAYYHTNDYANAIYYFNTKYLAEQNHLDDQGYYILGQSYYRTKEYSLASSAFNKIIAADDSLAQNAYYYLGDCYLELGDKKSAQNAFESASNFNFNMAITEHSNFNFAKLCYELGYPYADPTMILQDFINDFPKSEYLDETYSYLVNSFLTHKDYSKAIKSMESNGLENKRLQQAYQEVSYYRAVQLFNDGDYTNSILHFNKSLKYSHSITYQYLAHFWSGEAFYNLGEFENSIQSYIDFQNVALAISSPEYILASYHMAYANFKLFKFSNSIKYFKSFTKNASSSDIRLHDAFSRMGDAYYMLKEYELSIASYQKAIDLWGVDSDYAAYQIALAYHQMEQHQNVITHLSEFDVQYPSSTYKDDALYRMGESHIKLNETDQAISCFRAIEKHYPSSVFVADARMKVGLVLYNIGEFEQSISAFKRLVADYPSSSIAKEAITNARSVYVDIGSVASYATWLETLSFINVSSSALDSTSYESAELQYLKGDNANAYSNFLSYLQNYPEGAFLLPAHYYLAKSATEIDSLDQAIASYEYINSANSNKFSQSSIKESALLYMSLQQYSSALIKFEKLDLIAETVEEQLYAKQGLMDCYYELGAFDKAIEQAEIVLNSGRVDESLILELNTFIARSAFLNLDLNLAREKYTIIKLKSQGDLKAEAMYHLAYAAFYSGDYEASKKIIFEQSRLLPRYKNWLGKSFVILARNYVVEEDVFQAIHTLDQLLLNLEDQSVLKSAKSLKAEIMANENSVVEFSLDLDITAPSDDTIQIDSLKLIEK